MVNWMLVPKIALLLSVSAFLDADDRFPAISTSTDVAWLEQVASSLHVDDVEGVDLPGGLAGHAKDARTEAYTRLGALGTPESLAAIRRVEAHSKRVARQIEAAPSSTWIMPSWHWGDPIVKAFAEASASTGTYAITDIGPMGSGFHLLPPKSAGHASRRPVLLSGPVPEIRVSKQTLRVEGESLVVTYELRQFKHAPEVKESPNIH